jgi:8-oxo-dGTP pyrophosphatase MutT (NUDIX family)
MPAAPRPASTVVVVRLSETRASEVLMVRRNDKVAFMAGAFVFPGGRVDTADALTDPTTCCEGLAAMPGFPDLTPETELPYRVAAIRELAEEAAILLARDRKGFVAQDSASRVRAALTPGADFVHAISREGIRMALDALIPIAHWVTPEVESRRYDTRFFLAEMPEGQSPQHDAGETTELLWVSPAEAIERARRGEIKLPPPTWTTLRQLSRFATLDAVMTWARQARIVRVQPGLIRDGNRTMLTLPGDPLHPALPGWESPEDTRFVLEEGGGWRAVSS